MDAGRLRRAGGVGSVAVVLLAAGIASSAGGAGSPPAGDRAAIAFFRDEAGAFGAVAGARIVQTGYFSVRRGDGRSVDYVWGRPTPAGYVPARATILAHLGDGRIVAYLAEIRGRGIRTLRVLMAGGAVYTSTTRCWKRAAASASPLGTGERYVFNDGGTRYLPLRRDGARTTVTFTYEWGPGARAREASTFGAKSPPPVTVTIAVTGAQRLSIRKSIAPLREAPELPVPAPPGRPVPKPLCRVA